ncbi:MAG: PilZ domain-containing protein, partial [Desulfobacterales bacterium]
TKNGKLNPRNVTSEHDEKVWWLCENGHEWEATVKDRIMGEGCLVCESVLVKENSHKIEDSADSKKSVSDEGTISQKANTIFQIDSDETYKKIEYRKHMRYKYKATAILEDPISGKSIYAQMQNISNGGMYFETNVALKQGEKIKIKFKKPLSFTKSGRFTSIVRWCKELVDDEGYTYGYGLGVKFS